MIHVTVRCYPRKIKSLSYLIASFETGKKFKLILLNHNYLKMIEPLMKQSYIKSVTANTIALTTEILIESSIKKCMNCED